MAKKILVVDDEELVRKSVGRLLSREGYDLVFCKNGNEALKAVESDRFDLIVCDIRMPESDGITTVKNIREYHKSVAMPSPPEILITGYAEEAANKEAEKMQVAEYLYKPFDLRLFLDCVKKHAGE